MSGEIVAGDIIVIRYEGCKGAPGMKELMLSIDALIGLGLDKSVGLITDARFSGFNYGAIVGHVSPEAYDGGVIALIENGDIIEMDITNGFVNLLVSDEELAARRELGMSAIETAKRRPQHLCTDVPAGRTGRCNATMEPGRKIQKLTYKNSKNKLVSRRL